MKKSRIKNLELSKKSIALITSIKTTEIKGGTEPVSPPMSQQPDRHGVCYAIK